MKITDSFSDISASIFMSPEIALTPFSGVIACAAFPLTKISRYVSSSILASTEILLSVAILLILGNRCENNAALSEYNLHLAVEGTTLGRSPPESSIICISALLHGVVGMYIEKFISPFSHEMTGKFASGTIETSGISGFELR